jgi:hypothetical protein
VFQNTNNKKVDDKYEENDQPNAYLIKLNNIFENMKFQTILSKNNIQTLKFLHKYT